MLTLAAWLAAATARIRLVLAVLVVPHRPAVLAAKQLTTIDVLSGGRLTVGIGAGWLKAEFDAVVTTPFAERGAVTDEYVAAFRTLWTEKKPRITGKYVHYDGLLLEPKPVQQPHPPIWVGGESGPSLRRAAKLGDAWYPIGTNKPSARHVAALSGGDRPLAPADRGGRPRARCGSADLSGQALWRRRCAAASDGDRRLFSGSDADLIADIRALRDLGVTAIDFDFERPEQAAVLADLRSFSERVLAKARYAARHVRQEAATCLVSAAPAGVVRDACGKIAELALSRRAGRPCSRSKPWPSPPRRRRLAAGRGARGCADEEHQCRAPPRHLPIRKDWLAATQEQALEPDRPIIDPHHHLWDRPGNRYLFHDLMEDLNSGHNIRATVFLECREMYRAEGPPGTALAGRDAVRRRRCRR